MVYLGKTVDQTQQRPDPTILRENGALFAFTAVAVVAVVVARGWTAEPGLWSDLFHGTTFLALIALLWPLAISFLLSRLRTRDATGRYLEGWAGWRETWRRHKAKYLTSRVIWSALTAGLALAFLLNAYGSWKRLIPRLVPFAWDEPLARLDRWLHLGTDPWQLLLPLFGHPWVTLAMDQLYATWHPMLALMFAWQCWTSRRDLRWRFLLSVGFIWVGLGMLAATVLSSAGPCYHGFVVAGSDPFAPQLAFLHNVVPGGQLFAVEGQAMLWQAHLSGYSSPYLGISAMPSLHVAMPALYTAVTWARWRLLGAAFGAYTALTLIGSVHLGWHYAVDGYVSIAAVWVFWRLSARWTPRGVEAGSGRIPRHAA